MLRTAQDGRVGARLDEREHLARGILKTNGVEFVLGGALICKLHTLGLKFAPIARNVGMHEGERGRVK